MGCAPSVLDDKTLYWNISKALNAHTKTVLTPILKDFIKDHCTMDPNSHVMMTELLSAFYCYVRSRDLRTFMNKNALVRCFITLVKDFPGINDTGFYYHPDYTFTAIKGLSLKTYP